MRAKQPTKTNGCNESKEKAKHPGAVLGLIKGVYPAVLIVGISLAMTFLGFRSENPSVVQTEQTSNVSGDFHNAVAPEINASKHGTQ